MLGINLGCFSVKHEELGLAILYLVWTSFGEVTFDALIDSTYVGCYASY